MPTESQAGSHHLDYIFHPRSIALVGVSADVAKFWIKSLYFDSLLQSGYPGHIYLVNPRGGEIAGIPIHRSLSEISGPVDHVVVSIPAKYTLNLMDDCLAKGVRVVHMFASGFAETGEPDRIELQNRLVESARRGGIRIIGPNCLGIYYPKGGIGLSPDFPKDRGPIGYLCQSGWNVDFMVRHAAARGLRFSKVVSYGNACDINECDLLDYFADDPETRVIAAYIEGINDGRRFAQALKKAASAKPVIIFKGGYTHGGLRAAASHTGSLAGADAVWEGVIRQSGAIRVYCIEEMVDTLVALLRISPPKGRKTCIIGNGGGASVMATDEMERAGFQVAPMPQQIREKLKDFIDLANSMLRNPIDAGSVTSQDGLEFLINLRGRRPIEGLRDRAGEPVGGHWKRLHDVLKEWPDLDLVIFQHGFDISPVPVDDYMAAGSAGLMMLASREFELPKAIVLHSMANDNSWQATAELRALCADLGLPLFLSMRGAATAISRLIYFSMAHPEWNPGEHACSHKALWGRADQSEPVLTVPACRPGDDPAVNGSPVNWDSLLKKLPEESLEKREEPLSGDDVDPR